MSEDENISKWFYYITCLLKKDNVREGNGSLSTIT